LAVVLGVVAETDAAQDVGGFVPRFVRRHLAMTGNRVFPPRGRPALACPIPDEVGLQAARGHLETKPLQVRIPDPIGDGIRLRRIHRPFAEPFDAPILFHPTFLSVVTSSSESPPSHHR